MQTQSTTGRTTAQIDERLGSALRQVRTQAGLTQKAVADAAGVTFQQVQKYERGVNRIAVSTLPAMCEALGLSASEFMALALEEGQGASAPGAGELMRLFSVMRPDQRAAVLNIARAVAAPVPVSAVAGAEAA